MEQSSPKPARFPLGLLTVALVLSLLPGCAWIKGRQTASKIVADPERKEIADSKAGQKVATPVKLDGSATGNGAPSTPNAPGLAGAQILASGPAAGDPAAGLPSASNANDLDEMASTQSPDGSVVVAGSASSSAAGERDIVTADDRGDDDRAAAGDKPTISKADESLTNENSVFEFEGAGVKLKNGQVAASVNGQPVFVEDILRQMPLEMADHLAKAEQGAPPEQYRAMRQHYIKMLLEQHIDRELVLQALRSKIKEDQLKGIVKQIDAMYNSEGLPHAMNMAGVKTEGELEEVLRTRGSSIEILRAQFRNKELEKQYLGTKALPKTGFDRPDVLKYYQEHKEDYAIRATAKWEQIRLSYSKNGGTTGAGKKAAEILERLENDEEFATIAREYSDGPTAASKGGLRGWTIEGTLKDKKIERALYEQPVGEIGPPIETEDSIEIVRVIDRTPSGYESFEAVQDDIKSTLKGNLWQKATKALIKDLREKATIETFIDKL